MANERIYNVYDRKKLPRNKYGLLDEYGSSTSSSFSTSGAGGYGDWSDTPVGDIMATLTEFVGATATEDGQKGLVPAPLAGMQNYFLMGNGSWIDIPAYRWFTEWPESDGLEKRGLQLNGDLNVTDTITTMNLEVQGAAHFWSLIIDEVKANGGQLLVSPSMFHVDYVGGIEMYSIFDADGPLYQVIRQRDDIYKILKANDVEYVRCRRLWQRDDDGTRKIENECQIGDMLRCRSFNIKPGEYRNVSNTDYWSFVVNTGTGEYTDEDGNTYSAFYIDLAFTLRYLGDDGKYHNYPLGTTLYLDGREPEYPKGYSEITDALELKRTNQDIWDGTRDVEDEFFENSEWTDIQEYIIKIRGLDDEIENITGRYSNNKLYDNDVYLQKTKASLDNALYGVDSEEIADDGNNAPFHMSTNNLSNMILFGLPSSNMSGVDSEILNRQNSDISDSILGVNEESNVGLVAQRTLSNKILLARDTTLERDFVVAEDVYDDGYYGDDNHLIYHKGDLIDSRITIDVDVPVLDVEPDDKFFKKDKDEIIDFPEKPGEPLTPEETEIVETFDPETPSGMSTDVNSTIVEYDTLTSWAFGYTGYYPDFRIRVDDSLACLGHLFDDTRQNAIVLSSTNPIDPDLLAPAMAQYSHIDRFGVSISNYRQTAIAANGNEFIGSFFINYKDTYVEVNDRIQMFINDMTTGLEKVGIHLDGENSTITMVGSLDLRQHSPESYDYISMYDNFDTKRLEIKPFDIPKMNSADSQIFNSKLTFTTANNRNTAGKDYVSRIKGWADPFTTEWTYRLDNYILKLSTSVNLGQLSMGWKIDLRDLMLYLDTTTYLNGSTVTTNRGLGKQALISLSYTLKRDGVGVPGMQNVEVKDLITPGGINTPSINFALSTLVDTYGNPIDDYTIAKSGTYSLEVNLQFKVYATITLMTKKNKFDNYYYTISSIFRGTIGCDTKRVEQTDNDTNVYKMTIGTNGFVFANNNSRYFYAANDEIDLRWDKTRILMNNDNGLYIRKKVQEIKEADENKNVEKSSDIVYAKPGNSYTITLPAPSDFGEGRVMTIVGFGDPVSGKYLTVKTSQNSYIEIYLLGTHLSLQQMTFGNSNDGPWVSVQLMALGNNWYAVSSM